MIIEPATKDIHTFDDVERSRYSFLDEASRVERYENNEPLIPQRDIEEVGIVCEPYWHTSDDLEGDTYGLHIDENPDFTLSIRRDVLKRLVGAQKTLPNLWQIVLKAGYRPYGVQVTLLNAFIDKARLDHPDWTEDEVIIHAQKFVSDPQIVCPPHVTGGAVDIDVRDKTTGKMIDFGCPPNTDSELAFLHSDLISKEQYANRMTLLRAMLDAGFAPLASEWWHYQYGETYWAAFYGYKTTKYDLLGYNKE